MRLPFALVPFLFVVHATSARAEAPVRERHHCAQVALGLAGTFISGSTSEYHYPYSGSAVDLRADYRYCAVHHVEFGVGSDFFLASNWHGFEPALLVRGYLGPETRETEAGLHLRGGAAIIALPYGSEIGAQAAQSVRPLPHDELLLGPFVSAGIDGRYWPSENLGFETSLDLGLAWTSSEQPRGDGPFLAASISFGVVAGW